MNELRAILDALAGVGEGDEPSVLATVVQVLGSSYRGVGARRLVDREGNAIGLVSGGCLEVDVARQAWRLTEGGKPALIRYDSEDPSGDWTFGLGCRGTIDILVERIEAHRPHAWVAFLRSRLDRHEPAVLARVLRVGPQSSGARLGAFLALGADDEMIHDVESPTLACEIAEAARNSLVQGKSGHARVGGSDAVHAVLEFVEPPPTLIVCGAGPDALPLVRFARELGWHVAVVDGRHRPTTRVRFAEADEVATLSDPDRLRILASRPMAAAVIMTHNVVEDEKFLELLLPSPASYIGLLGPRHRASRLLAGLSPIAPHSRVRVHAPVGLDIGADTPAEIALAIVAEIRATLAGRGGGPLRDRHGPIHDRPDAGADGPIGHLPDLEGFTSSPAV